MVSLIALFLVPLAASFLTLSLSFLSDRLIKTLALFASLIPLLLLLYGGREWLQAEFNEPWIPFLSISFHLKMDAASLLFVFLTALVVPLTLASVLYHPVARPSGFYGLVLLLQALLIGFFTARDLAVFTLLWEAMLLPLYFLISFWGGIHREKAALKFLLYTFAGSLMMIAAVLALYFTAASQGEGTFNLDTLAALSSSFAHPHWLLAIFLLAFAVKTPLFPFHGWLPDAYYEAPMTGTILLSALLSKAGIYGIFRVAIALFPASLQEWSPWLLGLAVVGMLYGGFAAWGQADFKRLLAYSSFSHVNFILAGLFVPQAVAQEGALLQAFNHGITITALFLVAGWLEERIHTTAIGEKKGLVKFFPHLCWLTLFFVLSSMALPGTNNFIGEVLILFGLFSQNPWWAAVLALTVILTAIYLLGWIQDVYFKSPHFEPNHQRDLQAREWLIALPLIFFVLWVGLYPAPFLKALEPLVQERVVDQTENRA